MSFGVVQTMISTLRNNDNLRSKREKFKKKYGKNISIEKPEYDFPEATPEILNAIRKKIKKDNQILWLKVIILTFLILSFLVWITIK
ncbi:hypothetical protein [Winogradskyella endarachnes]|uniref:Uncharacterized protein n=1 Tax=Winogradskyella endarachnes TaxID=2681965 RepID=A0A6L6UAH5_9FLAO|nr:hypothetical protein [Winogradskyella endarachnes]MUU77907.1 hypothetical protein [Winogradskyella endarachnes]